MMEVVKCTGAVDTIIEDNNAAEAVTRSVDQVDQEEVDHSQRFADHPIHMVKMEYKRRANVVRARATCSPIAHTAGKT